MALPVESRTVTQAERSLFPMDGMSSRAFEILKQAMEKETVTNWEPGAWLRHKETPEDRAALESLPPHLGYPDGWNNALFLDGWDERSIWGFDRQDGSYFAQLWRNGSSSEAPDIWIVGLGALDGREYVVTTAHLLAWEISAATGLSMTLVCAAMSEGNVPGPSQSKPKPKEYPKPPISLADELREQGWF